MIQAVRKLRSRDALENTCTQGFREAPQGPLQAHRNCYQEYGTTLLGCSGDLESRLSNGPCGAYSGLLWGY